MIQPQSELFNTQQILKDGEKRDPVIENWLLVTNHKNLQYILAAGLIMPPTGFGNKYYEDPLQQQPGWIPVFANKVPLEALNQAVKEQGILRPVILKLGLSSISGKVHASTKNSNSIDEIDFSNLDEDTNLIFIPSPLPVSIIEEIYLQSSDDKKNLISEFKDVGNISTETPPLKVKKVLFKGSNDAIWPPASPNLPHDYDRSMHTPWALGGALTLLTHLANRGTETVEIQTQAFAPEQSDLKHIESSILNRFDGYSDNEAELLHELYWSAVENLVENNKTIPPKDPRGVFLNHLTTTANKLDDKKKQALLNLAKDLEDIARFPSKSQDELFKQHQKTFSRAALLFFLRKNSMEFLDFRNRQLREIDYIAAAILFSARDGWINLSAELRNIPGLQQSVTHRMAVYAHQLTHSGLEIGIASSRPQSLRELLEPGIRGWNKAQKEAALLLTRENKWDGVRTRITLGKGNYELLVDGRGMNILLDGEVKAVETEIKIDKLFDNIAHHPITAKSEQKARKLLPSKR